MLITIKSNQYIIDEFNSDFVYLRQVVDGIAYWPGIKIATLEFLQGIKNVTS